MTPFAKRIELEALVTEREGMIAENVSRARRNEATAYDDCAFDSLASSIRALAEEKPKPPEVSRRCGTCVYVDAPESKSPCYECQREFGLPHWSPSAPREPAPDSGPCGCEEAEELRLTVGLLRGKVSGLVDDLRTARAEVERLKQELTTAREQLPAWAKPVMVTFGACRDPDCRRPHCVAWLNLTPDQRRQCEEA